ncbi:ABC transporter substrate-binding protein [Longirhabdus pacifica]|uniref:ABC transporter substrate-binding protein n=1 Tax=Longirhabdus pacifica TaxID=2305227 RepID=UPI001008E71E|nr:ABC transporter substrate-binding protein [Longirhabdus pacifica]
MKKGITASISILLVLSLFLVGCSSDESEKVTVDIFQLKVEIVDQLQSLVDDFMEENPDIIINLDTAGGGEDYTSILKTRMSSGNQPAIFQVPGPTERDVWFDFLTDLSEEQWVRVTSEGLLDNITVDGKIYGQPVNIEGYGIIYNKAILEQAGISQTMINNVNSLSSLQALFEEVEQQKEALGLEATLGWSVGGTAWWVSSYHTFNVPFAMQQDPMDFIEALNDDTANFADNEQMLAFKDLVDTFVTYSYEDVAVTDYEKQYSDFASGKTAFIQQGNWTINQLNEIDENLDIAFLPIPISDNTSWANDSIPVGVPNYWVVNKKLDDEVIEAAKKFLDYMVMNERGQQFMVEEAKYIPAFTNVSVEKADPLAQSIITYVNDEKTIPWVWHAFPLGLVENDAKKAFQDYVNGDKTWDEILSFLDTQWDEKTK